MSFIIRVTPRAELDIDRAVHWLSHRSVAAGARWHNGLLVAVDTLRIDPGRSPLADEAANLGCELRELLYGSRRSCYRVLFTVEGDTVIIHRVRHAAQDRLGADDI